jgi:hypothetical protein
MKTRAMPIFSNVVLSEERSITHRRFMSENTPAVPIRFGLGMNGNDPELDPY